MDNALAHLGGMWAWDVQEITSDLAALESAGRWAVLLPYAGEAVCVRFGQWSNSRPQLPSIGGWSGPPAHTWASSMSQLEYEHAVEATRASIARGDAYQANICRVMSAPMPDAGAQDIAALYSLLALGNPAPHAGMLRVPQVGVHIACASPELFLERTGNTLKSGPIKGTGRTADDLLAKDEAENVMIVDLVRNDLSKVCRTGSVAVPALLRLEEHPGLVHLVSDVTGDLESGASWQTIIEAMFPPGSVTGTPKSSARRLISRLEPVPRGPYCGALGWVDADRGTASLAVTIRTFWFEGTTLNFGTGAGITWGSDPTAEWRETELKAGGLVALAAGFWQGEVP